MRGVLRRKPTIGLAANCAMKSRDANPKSHPKSSGPPLLPSNQKPSKVPGAGLIRGYFSPQRRQNPSRNQNKNPVPMTLPNDIGTYIRNKRRNSAHIAFERLLATNYINLAEFAGRNLEAIR